MSRFPNTMAAQFANEIAEANESASKGTGTGPFAAVHDRGAWYPTERFRQFVQSGQKFKWTLNTRGDIGVIDPTMKHSVAAGGGDVWTAGHGTYNATANTLTLDNDTGHYQTSEASLQRSRTAWQSIGYNVNFQARRDFAAALNRLNF